MDIWILNLIRKWLPSARAMVGVGLVALLALASVVAVGSALAAIAVLKGNGPAILMGKNCEYQPPIDARVVKASKVESL